jgi:hypothetical protein
MIAELQSQMGVIPGTHDFMQLFARADSDDLLWQSWSHGCGQINYADRGDLGHKNFSPLSFLQSS